MPSRFATVAILLFWLVVTGYVARREILPRYFADEPPRIDFVLVDELSTASTHWTFYRDDQKVGQLTTRTEYIPEDDTFRFITVYRNLKFEFRVPKLAVGFEVTTGQTTVRVTRDGQLREQTMQGSFEVQAFGLVMALAKTDVTGHVQNGQLVGRGRLESTIFDRPIEELLEPVSVSGGQALNPLMPLDRLRGVMPGRRWSIRESNPLFDSLRLVARKVLQKQGMDTQLLPLGGEGDELLAEVLPEPEMIPRPNGVTSCWVIRYESADKSRVVKTFVARDDGRVLRQEAIGLGFNLRFERQE
jgi:hypothetical protein